MIISKLQSVYTLFSSCIRWESNFWPAVAYTVPYYLNYRKTYSLNSIVFFICTILLDGLCIKRNGGLPPYSHNSLHRIWFPSLLLSLIRFPPEKGVRGEITPWPWAFVFAMYCWPVAWCSFASRAHIMSDWLSGESWCRQLPSIPLSKFSPSLCLPFYLSLS